MSAQPAPLGHTHAGQRECTRLVGYAPDGGEYLCGRPATLHVIYWWDENPAPGDAGFDHGYCCSKHAREFAARFTCAGQHAVNAACGMPGSRMHRDHSCTLDGLDVAEPVRMLAIPVTPKEGF